MAYAMRSQAIFVIAHRTQTHAHVTITTKHAHYNRLANNIVFLLYLPHTFFPLALPLCAGIKMTLSLDQKTLLYC